MNILGIVLATVVVGGVGLLIGILLGVAGEKFKVEVDEKEIAIRELLPGNNCGGCGYAGCDGLAKAIVTGEVTANSCPVGGADIANAIAEVLGVQVESVKKVAFVKCSGNCENTFERYKYNGNESCSEANYVTGGGSKSCSYGCLGYGECAKQCDFDAIKIVDGVAVIDDEKCVACGKCVSACPKDLIEIVPYETDFSVACSSKDKGKDVKTVCSTGCIGCKICQRICPVDAIKVEDNLAHIDYDLCVNCGACSRKCPVKIIHEKRI